MMLQQYQHDKVFCLGVGAQKAGTSWLHEQLNGREDANFGFLKEYHFLDALTLDSFSGFRPTHAPPWKWRTWRRNRFFQKPERYFDYFTKLLSKPGVTLCGDILHLDVSHPQLFAGSLMNLNNAVSEPALY